MRRPGNVRPLPPMLAALVIVLGGVLAGSVAHAQDRPVRGGGAPREVASAALQAMDAFTQLMTLEGRWLADWDARCLLGGEPAVPVEYRSTAGGTALLEVANPGGANGEPELVNIYSLEGDGLVMTHYCAMGNHPQVQLDTAASTATEFIFGFTGPNTLLMGNEWHMHLDRMSILDVNNVVQDWSIWQGSILNSSHRVFLTRILASSVLAD